MKAALILRRARKGARAVGCRIERRMREPWPFEIRAYVPFRSTTRRVPGAKRWFILPIRSYPYERRKPWQRSRPEHDLRQHSDEQSSGTLRASKKYLF